MDNELQDRLDAEWLRCILRREPLGAWRTKLSDMRYDIMNKYIGHNILYPSVTIRMGSRPVDGMDERYGFASDTLR